MVSNKFLRTLYCIHNNNNNNNAPFALTYIHIHTSICVLALNLCDTCTQTTKFCLLLSFNLKFESNFILYHKKNPFSLDWDDALVYHDGWPERALNVSHVMIHKMYI